MGIKLTKRKGFNFFRSYYDVYNELETIEDKVAFIDALLDRQFLGIKPENLKGIAKFAYISQTNSIDSQVKGYEDKTGTKLTPTQGGFKGSKKVGKDTPLVQEEEEEEEQEKYKNIYRSFRHLSITNDEVEKLKIEYDIKTIDSVLDSIENYKNNKNYTSLYLTAKNWLKKEPKKEASNPNGIGKTNQKLMTYDD
jgi:hypothetical protein